MTNLYDRIQATHDYIIDRIDYRPTVGLILGTGLGDLADEIDVQASFEYEDLPNFPVSTVASHRGQLLLGELAGQRVVCMAGRFHYYEGYSMQEVTFPVRVMKALGADTLIVSNVAGGTNQHLRAGDLVALKDHINLQPDNPLRGPNDERLGVRFPDMMHTYDAELRLHAQAAADAEGLRLYEGVYVALPGPNLETPAEYQYIHRIGGDLVGMSTVPEVIVARHAGLRVLALSLVSNTCYPPEVIQETTLESVIAVARQAGEKLQRIVKGVLARL